MSSSDANRTQGLQRSISDLFPEDEDDDILFEPASEQSIDDGEDEDEDEDEENEEEDEDAEFAGTKCHAVE